MSAGYPVEQLSYSSLDLYSRCPFAWKRHYVDRVRPPRTPALVFGSAVHSALERLAVALTGDDAPDAGAVWAQCWAAALPELATLSAPARDEMERTGRAIVTDTGLHTTLRWLGVRRDADGPVIERKFSMRVVGVPVPVIGFIDLVDGFGVPCDFKTAARPWEQHRAGTERQPRVYLAALEQAGYRDNPERVFRHIVITKQPVTVTTHETHWHGGDVVRTHRWIREKWEGIAAGRFDCGGDPWCPAAEVCPQAVRFVGRGG